MTHTYATAATQHVQAGGTRYAYPPLGRTKFVKFKAIGINRAGSMWPKDATR